VQHSAALVSKATAAYPGPLLQEPGDHFGGRKRCGGEGRVRKEGVKKGEMAGRRKGRTERRGNRRAREKREHPRTIEVSSLGKDSRGNCLSNNFKEMTF
jgi:hypothetical protein